MVLEVSGGSRQKSTYYANVLSALPKSPRSKPDARAKVFRAWVESPLILAVELPRNCVSAGG